MPTHLHMILVFERKFKLSDFMRDFKKWTSVKILENLHNENEFKLLRKMKYRFREQKHKVWQDRFDGYSLKHPNVVFQKMLYIHQNPVKKKLVEKAEDYFYSSAGFYKGHQNLFMPVNDLFEVMGWDERTLYL